MKEVYPITCVVLAGGLGTRLRSLIDDRPKCLAPVGERSFLDIQMATLAQAGVETIVLSLGYLAKQVINAVETATLPIPVRYVVETTPLGTGGAVANVLDTLGLDEVLVANGDTYLDGDLSPMLIELNRAGGEMFRMAVVSVPDRKRFGGVEADADGKVTGFLSKGCVGAGHINAGLYRLCRAALPPRGSGAYSLESKVLPELVKLGNVRSCSIAAEFIDIGIPSDYLRFCALRGVA